MELLYSDDVFIEYLMPNMSSHHVVSIPAEVTKGFPKGTRTRVLLKVDNLVEIQCGLNARGPGERCMMISKANMEKGAFLLGQKVHIDVYVDPNPLGVEIPEVLEALIAQDPIIAKVWDKLSDGRKRTICHSTKRIKNIDLQVERALEFFEAEREKQAQKWKK
ncbi:MAG: hypothetical protein RL754_103 [Bacteroidota bacterium]|jgi:hypothetical protein